MEGRLFDRNNYSSKTNEIYEILSAYYVDIFYNHLHTEAKKLKTQSSVSSITEGYKHTLNAFLKGLNNPKLYKKSLIGIHHYFINIGLASITFSRCIDKITEEFIPTDYYASLSSTQKMGVLRMVINQSIKQFIKKIVDEHMVKIIDNHKDKDNVRILQDDLIDCFIIEREGMYQRFIASKTKTNSGSQVNLMITEKMQAEIKKLVKEKYVYKKQINLLTKAYNLQKTNEKKYQDTIAQLKRKLSNSLHKNNSQNNYSQNNYSHNPEENKYNQSFIAPSNKSNKSSSVFSNLPHINQYDKKPEEDLNYYQNEKISVIHPRKPLTITNLDNSPPPNSPPPNSPPPNSPTPNSPTPNSPTPNSPSKSDEFIEVNSSNISDVINGDSEYLQQLSDSRIFNDEMDETTTLVDF
jgi:hypothetical protein